MILTREERKLERNNPRNYCIPMKGILILESSKNRLEVTGELESISSTNVAIFSTTASPKNMTYCKCRLIVDWPVKLDGRIPLKLELFRASVMEIHEVRKGARIIISFSSYLFRTVGSNIQSRTKTQRA